MDKILSGLFEFFSPCNNISGHLWNWQKGVGDGSPASTSYNTLMSGPGVRHEWLLLLGSMGLSMSSFSRVCLVDLCKLSNFDESSLNVLAEVL